MRFMTIIAIILAGIAVIFIFQNINPITISFFTLEFEAPVAIILFFTLLIGFVIGALLVLPSLFRAIKESSRLGKENVLFKKNSNINPVENKDI